MAITKSRLKVLLYGNSYGAYRSENLVKFLMDFGYRISWVCPEFYQERGVKRDFVSKVMRAILSGAYGIELFVKATLADVIYVLPFNNNSVLEALKVARLFKKKLVVEMTSCLYDRQVKEMNKFEENSKEARELKAKDIIALTQADYSVTASQSELNYWEKLLNTEIDRRKVFVSPLFPDPALAAMKVKQYRQNLEEVIRICWWGTFEAVHGLDDIIQALKILKEKGINYQCHLFGIPPTGHMQVFYNYQEKLKADGLDDRVTLNKDLRFSDGSLPQYLVENCDLVLGLFMDGEGARASLPTKVVEALIMGLPTLNMKAPAFDEFFESEVDLWMCEPFSEAIAEAIAAIANGTAYPVNWEQTRQKALNAFSLAHYRNVLQKVFCQVEADLQNQ
ncbi:glycosyltransferase [Oscillatoria sp. FACHB-1406]|uniref:glycosyltransferase n=1 Tax=Oscillatoria sp. FACHB-1406 TaxID=2692846 RepID=UPI00168558D3|nr:glycosyltransferase [Oscillatoria sp. FACHB-1406]MBD2577589.1 glycosyltransferase family 4 protein [Oscillatoria sp. FACHB-1406]